DEDEGRITLTHRELLGTWEQNIAHFEVGQTVRGIVRGIEQYGVFVELAPNLSGLAERRDDIKEGDAVSVYIKNIAAQKMKIKLIIIDVLEEKSLALLSKRDYFITDGHIDTWQYSPIECEKKNIQTVFTD
ncbi:MAG: 30S ribosomal protein S1, partial [Clostridia bacterium]